MQSKHLVLALLIFSVAPVFGQSVEQGLKHLELEQYESSKKVFRSLLKKDPGNPEYYYYLGDVYLKTEIPDSARYYFTEGIKRKEDFALNHAGLGKIVYMTHPSEGKKHLDKALELCKSKDPDVLAAIAEHYISTEKKDLPQAISLLEAAIKKDSKNPKPYILLGDAYLAKHDGSKAITYYKQGFELNKTWPYPYLKIGKLYGTARNYNLAVDYYKKGLEIDPSYGPLHREVGEVYYKAGMYDKAIASYKKYVELSDKNFDTDLRYASFLYLNKDYKSAISILSDLLKKEEKHPVVNRLLAYSYYETKDYEKGLTTLENYWKNTDSKKYIAEDYAYYGKLLAKTGKDSLGIMNIRKAIEMDTSRSDLYAEIGNIYFLAKRYQDAAREYETKVSREATAQDYLILGKAYYYDKLYEQADTAFSKLVDMIPASPTGYLWRARANAYLDEDLSKGLARPFYEKFIELMPASETENYKRELIEAYSALGAYHMKNKDKANADIAWKKVKELDPSNKEVDKYISADY